MRNERLMKEKGVDLPGLSYRKNKIELLRKINQSAMNTYKQPSFAQIDSENLFPIEDVHFNNHIRQIKSYQEHKINELRLVKR